jgi:predicted transglutaminase-like cysteine proteinase
MQRRSTTPLRHAAAALPMAAWFFAGALLAQQLADLGFTTRVSNALVAQYAQRFGPATPERISRWKAFARDQKATPVAQRLGTPRGRDALLQTVNDAINGQVKWLDDKEHWGAEDYWATPAESIGSAGGDCEDYSIAKYYLLKEIGVPIERLRITYVRALKLNGQAHMVLAYYATPDAEPLLMDNLDPRVRPASERRDLEPVYSFNDDEVQLVQGGRRGKPSQIRAWLHVQERLLAESSVL